MAILELMAAVADLEKVVEQSRLADAQRDSMAREAAASVAFVKAAGLADGECARLRMAADRLCKLLRAEGV